MFFVLVPIFLIAQSPANISSELVLWLDAEDLDGDNIPEALSENGLTGSEVMTWIDKSGQGNDVSGVNRPDIIMNQLNGKPVLDFNNDRLLTTASGQITPNGSYTKFVVFKYDVTNTNNNLISSDLTGSAFWGGGLNSISVWNLAPSYDGIPGHITSGPIGTDDYYIAATRYDNVDNDSNLSILNLNGEEVGNDDGVHQHTSQVISIGAHGDGNYLDGKIAEAIVYNRALNDTEIDAIEAYLSTKWNIALVVNNSIALEQSDYPQYKVFQRDANDQYDFNLSGTYTGNPTAIEASFDGNVYTVIDSNPTGGSWSGVLENQTVGQGRLSVRFTNDSAAEDGVDDIGVGDVYVVAGQSNAEGHALTAQSYTTVAPTASVFPTVYTEDDIWKIGNDDTDPGGDVGSVWPILGGYIVEHTGIPVSFITTATGATGLVTPPNWQNGAAAYNVMPNQVNEANPNAVKAVLWFQGESDAFYRVNRNAYKAGLEQLLIDIHTDLPGTPDLVPGVIGAWSLAQGGANNPTTEDIRLATIDAWNDNPNILNGPQTYDIQISNDGIGDHIHFQSDDEIQTLGFRWWKALENHYYSGTSGRGPVISSAELISGNTQIELTFNASSSLLPMSGLATDIWFVKNDDTDIAITAAEVTSADKVTLTLAQPIALPTNVTVSYAKGNTAEGKTVLTDSTLGNTAAGVNYLPADVFSDFPVSISTAPGNVGANLVMWLKADEGGVNWADQSYYGNNVNPSGSPTLVATGMNFNPVIDFDNNEDYYTTTNTGIIGTNNPYTKIAVVQQREETGTFNIISGSDDDVTTGSNHALFFFNSYHPRSYHNNVSFPALNITPSNTAPIVVENVGAIIGARYGSGGPDNMVFVNAFGNVDTNTPPFSDEKSTQIGNFISSSNDLSQNGYIAEVMIYNSEKTDQELQRIQSYLALKYGISLNQNTPIDYIASDGTTTIWSHNDNMGYTSGIFGIGRDDAQALDQRISKSVNANSILTIALDNDFIIANNDASRTTTFQDDLDFLVISNNGGNIAMQSSELDTSTGLDERLTREWKVSNIGNVGAVNLRFEGFDNSYSLIAKTADGDFSNGINNLGQLNANGEINIALTDGMHFTLAVENSLSTGVFELDRLKLFNDKDKERIVINGTLSQSTDFSLYDLQGRLVYSTTLQSQLNEQYVDVSNLSQGVYVVDLKNKNIHKTKKIIVQ